jgi:hypothetical protein
MAVNILGRQAIFGATNEDAIEDDAELSGGAGARD